MYGSRNPVAMLLGTSGWGMFVAAPWGQVDLRKADRGLFLPWKPTDADRAPQNERNQQQSLAKGLPPPEAVVPGLYDLFIFDAHDPAKAMKDFSVITGPAAMPPLWALGYMQSHRTLEDDTQMLGIVETFRQEADPARRGDLPRHRLRATRLEHQAAVLRLQPGGVQARPERGHRRHARASRKGRRPHGAVGSRQAADAAGNDPASTRRERWTHRTSTITGSSTCRCSKRGSTPSGPTKGTGSTCSSASSGTSSTTRGISRPSRTYARGACSATATPASRSGAGGSGRATPTARGRRSRPRSPSASTIRSASARTGAPTSAGSTRTASSPASCTRDGFSSPPSAVPSARTAGCGGPVCPGAGDRATGALRSTATTTHRFPPMTGATS